MTMAISSPKSMIERELFSELMHNGHLLPDEYLWDHAAPELVVRLGILKATLAAYESLSVEAPTWMSTLVVELSAHLQNRLVSEEV